MISQPRSSMNSWTLASISRSRTPGLSHVEAGALQAGQRSHVDVVYSDALLLEAGRAQYIDDALRHPVRHVRNRSLCPLPCDGRFDAILLPGKIDFGALQV